jgi:hypothetical protein
MNPLSGVLGEAWRMYRAHAAHLITIAVGIYLVAAVLEGLLYLAGGVVGAIVGLLISFVASFLVQAALVKAAQDIRDGRADLSVGQTVSAASQVIWPVAGASILAGLAIVAGLILLIVPGLYLITIWAVIVPVLVIERTRVFSSFGRSQQLVRGNGWNVFGVLVITFLILLASQLVVALILTALPQALSNAISTVITGALVAPFQALVVTTIYFRLIGVESGVNPAQPQWPGGDPAYPPAPGYPGGSPSGDPPYPPGPGYSGGSPSGDPPYPPPPGGPAT